MMVAFENFIALIGFFIVFPIFMFVVLNMDDWIRKHKYQKGDDE